jgi:hypothetical protein
VGVCVCSVEGGSSQSGEVVEAAAAPSLHSGRQRRLWGPAAAAAGAAELAPRPARWQPGLFWCSQARLAPARPASSSPPPHTHTLYTLDTHKP